MVGKNKTSVLQLLDQHKTDFIIHVIVCQIVSVIAIYVYDYRLVPPLGTDALDYHLGYPAHWIKEGWFRMIPPWCRGSEVPYDPLLGEFLYGLLMVPWRSDIVARFLQFPFLILSGYSVYAIAMTLGCRKNFSILSGLGVLVFPPFMQQLFIGYNDIIFMAFFLLCVLVITRLYSATRRGQEITLFGMTLGFLMATKYLALVYAPPLVTVFVAAFLLRRGDLRRVTPSKKLVLAVLGIILFALGTPTYIRNFILTGNPFYPADVTLFGTVVFDGLYNPASFARWHSLGSSFQRFIGAFHNLSIPAPTGTFLLISSFLAFTVVLSGYKRFPRNRCMALLTLFLIPLGVLLLLHYPCPFREERFLFPLFGLLWVYAAVVCTEAEKMGRQISFMLACIFGAIVLISASESFKAGALVFLQGKTLALACGVYVVMYLLFPRLSLSGRRILICGIVMFLMTVFAFISAYRPWLEVAYRVSKKRWQEQAYADLGVAWNWLDDETRESPSLICYSGISMVYPLFGSKLQNRVCYVHIGPGNFNYLHEYGVHFSPDSVVREQGPERALTLYTEEIYRKNQDFNFWLKNIRALQCDYLFVARGSTEEEFPIEAQWAMGRPELFGLCVNKPRVKVFRCLFPEKK